MALKFTMTDQASLQHGVKMLVYGLSGSGKSVALHALEDAGYFCVDNLPPELLREFINESGEHLQNIELGVLTLEENPTDADTLNSIFRAFTVLAT